MNLQARRISGSSYTSGDEIEIILNTDNQIISNVVHTIEMVSGIAVTHGGNAEADTYLHYKATERDSDENGIIDYSTINMMVSQKSQGTSVIKAVARVTTKEDEDAFQVLSDDWAVRYKAARENDLPFKEDAPNAPTPTILTTGEITLEWSDDNFV